MVEEETHPNEKEKKPPLRLLIEVKRHSVTDGMIVTVKPLKPKCFGNLFRECKGCEWYKECLETSMGIIVKVAEHCKE